VDELQDALWISHGALPSTLHLNESIADARARAGHEGLVNRTAPSAPLPRGMASRELTVDLVVGLYT
jgi:hypothetical protein